MSLSSLWSKKVSIHDQDSEIQEKLENPERNNFVFQELVPKTVKTVPKTVNSGQNQVLSVLFC